jgi:hypothetical protein
MWRSPQVASSTQLNFLRLSTLEEKEAIGITEQPDPASVGSTLAWGY